MTWAVKMADARYDGYDEGYEKGISVGLERGRATGREEGISIGLERGRATGREEGAYQKALETAKSFLSMGLEPEQVAQGTGLSLEVIQKLID